MVEIIFLEIDGRRLLVAPQPLRDDVNNDDAVSRVSEMMEQIESVPPSFVTLGTCASFPRD
jgi:hypothetical protein